MLWENDGAPLIAVTSDKTTLVGPLTKQDIATYNVTYGVAGFGVIVSDGQVCVCARSITDL